MSKKEKKIRPCISGLKIKEEVEGDGVRVGVLASTHPDKVGDILSINCLHQIVDFINTDSVSGTEVGAYRSISLYHDWIHKNDPTLDEAGIILPGAKVVTLDDGHHGVEVKTVVNKYYHGDISPEEIGYRIDKGLIAGLSIEYDTNDQYCKTVVYNGKSYRFIEKLTEYGGAGYARARMIANPHTILYKEIEIKAKEGITMADEKNKEKEALEKEKLKLGSEKKKVEDSKKEMEDKQKELEKKEIELQEKETKLKTAGKKLSVKEVLESKEFNDAVEAQLKLKVKSKVLKTKEGDDDMGNISLSVKEMNKVLGAEKFNKFQFKEAASMYFKENEAEIESGLMGSGIPLKTTLQIKCNGTKLKIVGQLQTKELQTKDMLDTGTNTTAFTQSPVEFADVYLPGLVDTFNNQTNLFGELRKVDHLAGGNYFGWKIRTSQSTSLAVDPDDASVTKTPIKKVKLRTDIKEYRLGVSVSDYTLHHSRATMGDLFMIEVEATARDVMKDINKDLFTEQVDTAGNKILGLEAVADSAGNTSMYGLTRTTTNRLAPTSATDTYEAVGGALTSLYLRKAVRKVEVEGARRENLRYVCDPIQRDHLFELEDGAIRYGTKPRLGFDGKISFDSIPMIVDSDCQNDAIFVVDFESYYVVVSKGPQLVGLARVGAAEEAFVSIYLAAVYEQPRRIHMLDTLTA